LEGSLAETVMWKRMILTTPWEDRSLSWVDQSQAPYMTLTEAVNEAIWLKGLAIESRFELKIVAGIDTRALSKAILVDHKVLSRTVNGTSEVMQPEIVNGRSNSLKTEHNQEVSIPALALTIRVYS
ncbi:hypothetical protein Tco_1063497, partial [Tanacetum coccineum]